MAETAHELQKSHTNCRNRTRFAQQQHNAILTPEDTKWSVHKLPAMKKNTPPPRADAYIPDLQPKCFPRQRGFPASSTLSLGTPAPWSGNVQNGGTEGQVNGHVRRLRVANMCTHTPSERSVGVVSTRSKHQEQKGTNTRVLRMYSTHAQKMSEVKKAKSQTFFYSVARRALQPKDNDDRSYTDACMHPSSDGTDQKPNARAKEKRRRIISYDLVKQCGSDESRPGKAHYCLC